jgi:hypothetical protein
MPVRTIFVDLAQPDALKLLSEKLHLEEINLSSAQDVEPILKEFGA